jgi:hypothetical protein
VDNSWDLEVKLELEATSTELNEDRRLPGLITVEADVDSAESGAISSVVLDGTAKPDALLPAANSEEVGIFGLDNSWDAEPELKATPVEIGEIDEDKGILELDVGEAGVNRYEYTVLEPEARLPESKEDEGSTVKLATAVLATCEIIVKLELPETTSAWVIEDDGGGAERIPCELGIGEDIEPILLDSVPVELKTEIDGTVELPICELNREGNIKVELLEAIPVEVEDDSIELESVLATCKLGRGKDVERLRGLFMLFWITRLVGAWREALAVLLCVIELVWIPVGLVGVEIGETLVVLSGNK